MEALNRERHERDSGGRTVPHDETFEAKNKAWKAELVWRDETARALFPKSVHQLQEWYKSVDMPVLKEIYAEYLEKSGVPEARHNVPNIPYFLADDEAAPMAYSPGANSLLINAKYFDEKLHFAPPHVVRAEFMEILFHEFAHASGYSHISWASDPGDHGRMVLRYGLQQNEKRTAKIGDDPITTNDYSRLILFRLLNEGITEQIAHEVTFEYFKRNPHDAELKKEAKRGIGRAVIDGTNEYDIARKMVMAITGALAKDSGLSEEVVWRGFVKQYFTGELQLEEFVDLLNETMGEGFGETLATAENGNDLKKIEKLFAAIDLQKSNTIDRWLEHLKLARGAK